MGSTPAKAIESSDFFRLIPGRSVVVFHVAVFCIFSPIGMLFVSTLEPRPTWLAAAVSLVVSGLISVCWAATFTVSRWFIVGIVVTTLLMMALNGVWSDSPVGLGRGAPSPVNWTLIAAIVAGYVLFIVFISGQGRTTVRLLTEMSLARDIHATLVPALRHADERLEALGYSSPSTEMGGDLIDVIRHGSGTDLFVADVSGHGVRAGVVMGMLKAAIRIGLRKTDGLAALLEDLNDVLEETTSAELYATLAGLRVDGHGRVEYVLAGHHHIAHYRAATSDVHRLEDRTFPLGLFDGRTYATRSVSVEPGDLLAIYTDGLNETADATDHELGHEAIESAIGRLANRALEEIRLGVFDVVERHGAQQDDRTLLLVRFA